MQKDNGRQTYESDKATSCRMALFPTEIPLG